MLNSFRYGLDIFYGVMIDIKASHKSTVGENQVIIYRKLHDIKIIQNSDINVTFSIGNSTSSNSLVIKIFIGTVEFHIIDANILFLFCFRDIN